MVDLIICSRNPRLLEICLANAKKTAFKEFNPIIIQNNPRKFSLTEAYNLGIQQSKSEILVFMHEDVWLLSKNWDEMLRKIFSGTANLGVVGVAGTNYLDEIAQWYIYGANHCRGAVMHSDGQRIWVNDFGGDPQEPIAPVVVVDGVFMACRKEVILKNNLYFSEAFNHFHFYDISWSAAVFRCGFSNVVTREIQLLHLGLGDLDENWDIERKKFVEKFRLDFPLKVDGKLQLQAQIPGKKIAVQDPDLLAEIQAAISSQ